MSASSHALASAPKTMLPSVTEQEESSGGAAHTGGGNRDDDGPGDTNGRAALRHSISKHEAALRGGSAYQRYCSPRHPTNFEPSFPELNVYGSIDVASNIWLAVLYSERGTC